MIWATPHSANACPEPVEGNECPHTTTGWRPAEGTTEAWKTLQNVTNIIKCNKVYKLYKINEIVQNVNIVQFVTNFTKIIFLKKCEKVKNGVKFPGWPNGTYRHKEQEREEAKELDELISVL